MLIVSAVVHVLSPFSLFFFFYVGNDVQPLLLLVLSRVVVVLSVVPLLVVLLLDGFLSADYMLHWGLLDVYQGRGLWLVVHMLVV